MNFTATMLKKKKEEKAVHIPKVIVLLAVGFVFKLFFSCTPFSDSVSEITYNTASIEGIDNSGMFMEFYSTTDTLYSEAVALKLTLSDSSVFYAASCSPGIMQGFSFRAAHATSINQTFVPVHKVKGIKVKTLLDMNDSIKAGDDITAHILCSQGNSYRMYSNLNQGISWLNGVQSEESSSIVLVLKKTVKNTNARLEVAIILDNGDELLCTTKLFTIIDS